MIRDFFNQFNVYLIGHPALLAKLKLLFWIKYWALMILMLCFVLLIYRERGWRRQTPLEPGRAEQRFEA